MALIKCPECGKEVSDTSKNCIHCGYVFKEENNVTQPQKVVHVEVPKKEKSSKNFLVIGITLHLFCLAITVFNAEIVGSDGPSNNLFREWLINENLFSLSKVVAVISLIYSLVLLAVPKLRKISITIPYLLVNLLSLGYMLGFLEKGCSIVTTIPQFFAWFVSVVLIFISFFIRDEK